MQPPKLGRRTFLNDSSVHAAFANPRHTGRYLLIFGEGGRDMLDAVHLLERRWGLSVATTADFVTSPPDEGRLKDADALVFSELGVALVGVEEAKAAEMGTSGDGFRVVPEKVVYVPYGIAPEDGGGDGATWGIEMTGVLHSPYRGDGVKVAVLDTGFDSRHPDFEGRTVTAASFVPDEAVDDLHGHGTHCAGIACGNADLRGERYGVATGAHIHVGKVLDNQGSGAQSWILNGMIWAAKRGCRVLSMSLATPVREGEGYDIAYERAARFVRSQGMLVVAAAGNDSRRSADRFSPVASPADCPSILAVAAVDRELRVGDFSNRAVNPTGLVDIAAPGVSIRSCWPMPARYRTLSGTSMAAPFVAGIAALFFEKFPDATPAMVENELRKNARPLPLPDEDVGDGLSIAPG